MRPGWGALTRVGFLIEMVGAASSDWIRVETGVEEWL